MSLNSSQLEFSNYLNTMRETFTIPLFSKHRLYGTFSNLHRVFPVVFSPTARFLQENPSKIFQTSPPPHPQPTRGIPGVREQSEQRAKIKLPLEKPGKRGECIYPAGTEGPGAPRCKTSSSSSGCRLPERRRSFSAGRCRAVPAKAGNEPGGLSRATFSVAWEGARLVPGTGAAPG